MLSEMAVSDSGSGVHHGCGSGVVEVVTFPVPPDERDAFSARLRSAIRLIEEADGYCGHSFGPCAEDAGLFVLLVWWASLEAHTHAFRGTTAFDDWREALSGSFTDRPVVRHFHVEACRGRGSAPA